MGIVEFLISVLIVYGISAIIVLGKVFEPLRNFTERRSPEFWHYLTACMQCVPFWIGIFVAFSLRPPMIVDNPQFPEFINVFLTYLFAGALYSGTTFFLHTIWGFLKIDD